MARALLVVDVQNDYLNNDKLVPSAFEVTENVRLVLEDFRTHNLPVAHIRTGVQPGVAEAMPHRRKAPRCILGTSGYEAPKVLKAAPGELVAHKQHFRGFADPALDVFLSDHSIDEVVIVGLYTHACIRETTLDAYERGLEVTLPVDALGSDSPSHARETLDWIGTRAAKLSSVAEVIRDNDRNQRELDIFPELNDQIQALQLWSRSSILDRKSLLERWASKLEENSANLADAIALEVNKPEDLALGEVSRAIAHIQSAVDLLKSLEGPEVISAGVEVLNKPVGLIAALMPWNNPLALPVSKIAPALATGNAVTFKPSPMAETVAALLLNSLIDAGMPKDLVGINFGGAEAALKLARDRRVHAVTLTGSISAGRQIAMVCAARNIPLQAELGGNNAAIIWTKNASEYVPEILENAFLYSGQRCTAARRVILPIQQLSEFTEAVGRFLKNFELDSRVINASSAQRIDAEISEAIESGAKLVCGGTANLPTALVAEDSASAIVQNESFGPVIVIQPANDLRHAIELANGVEQGLVLFFKTDDDEARVAIETSAQVGIIQNGLGPLPVHTDAPFAGWKASGNSSPEHGRWDLSFYTKPQVRYGN